MTIEERIAQFWDAQPLRRLSTAEVALWFALLEKSRECGFPSFCEVSNEWLCTLLDVDVRTLRTARNGLVEKKVITFVAGTGKKQPSYGLEVEQAQFVPLPIEEPKPTKVKAEERPRTTIKRPQKPKTTEPLLFKPEKVKPKPKEKAEEKPPTQGEVRELFRMRGYDEAMADEFFYYYDAQGWVTTGGQKIKRIDSMVNRWLSNEKRKDNGKVNRTAGKTANARNEAVARYVLEGLQD